MFELNIDYVMIGVLGIFLALALYIVAKPTLDTIQEHEEERSFKKDPSEE